MNFKEHNKSITERIIRLCGLKRVTFYQLEKDLGIKQSTLSSNKIRNSAWSVENLIKISDYFKVSLDHLITGKEFNEQERIKQLEEMNEYNINTVEELAEDNLKLKHAIRILTNMEKKTGTISELLTQNYHEKKSKSQFKGKTERTK